MNHVVKAHPRIICPACKTAQTGIVRHAKEELFFSTKDPEDPRIITETIIVPGELYIVCCRPDCKYVIAEAELQQILF